MTPTFSTIAMGIISAVFFIGLTLVSQNVLADSALSVGLLIAFYYGMTGFACVWYFRSDLFKSAHAFFFKGLFPLLGALTLLGAFILSLKANFPASSSSSSLWGMGGIFVIGVGSLLLGVALMFLTRRRSPEFFRGTILNRNTVVQYADGVASIDLLSFPDAPSHEHLIEPPLSVEQLRAAEADARQKRDAD
jgi:amino acid transporter